MNGEPTAAGPLAMSDALLTLGEKQFTGRRKTRPPLRLLPVLLAVRTCGRSGAAPSFLPGGRPAASVSEAKESTGPCPSGSES